MEILEKLRKLITKEQANDPEPQEPQTKTIQDQMSDEGQVLRLLVENDGQVKRSELLEATGWEQATAEKILSEMEASDEIRITSRGNDVLVCRPGYEPEGHQKI